MATYLQGVTPYIPQIQPFTPDLTLYSGVLQFKQSRQDAAREQLSNMYGSLLNSPLTRDDNMATRDQFFKTIDQDIKKMANMDLSKRQNVGAAMGVFSQMLDNQYLVKDMVWTRKLQNELRRGEGFRNCINPEECGGSYWDGGIKYLQYKAEEFKNATRDESMAFGNVRYIPQQNVTKKAMALAKEAGLNISIDQLQGGYITTTKNGPMLVGPLQNLFMGSLGNDPAVTDYYKTKAYVDRKDWVTSNAPQYGSVEAAEQAYVTKMTPALEKYFSGAQTQIEDKAEVTGRIKKDLETQIINNGVTERDPLAEAYRELTNQEIGYRSSQEVINNASSTLNAASSQSNPKYSVDYVDAALANILLGEDINAAAETLAYKDYEFKMKEDPYSMENYRQKNRLLLEEVRFQNKLAFEKYKFGLEQYAEQLAATGGGMYNQGKPIDVLGGTDAGLENELSYDITQGGFRQFAEDREVIKNDLSSSERDVLNQVYSSTMGAAQAGNTQAQADLIAIVDAMANSSMTADETISGVGEGDVRKGKTTEPIASAFTAEQAAQIKAQLSDPNATHDQKYAIAKRYAANINNLGGSDIDEIYEGTIKHMYARKDGNEVLRPHLDAIWENTAQNRREIEAKYAALEQMDQWYADEAAQVIGAVRTTEDYGDLWADAFESYIDDKGHTVTKDQFVESMMSKGYYQTQAEALWGGDRRLKFNEYYDEETGEIKSSFWSGVSNTVVSVLDAIGTTVAGYTGELVNVVEWALPGLSAEGEWGEGWGSEEVGWGNWDYDSPADVANWGGYGQESGGGYGNSPNVGKGYGTFDIGNRGYNDDIVKGAPGIHDQWQRAFSQFVTPDGAKAWLGMGGAGNEAAMGVRYDIADPKYYRSVATMGTVGYLQDALNSSNTVVDIGGPKVALPEASIEGGQDILNTLYKDMITMKKGESRPMPQVTYQDIAGGSSDMTALNIVLNQPYVNKYKGSKDAEGLMRPYMDKLTTEGMTVYLPKAEAQNIFAQASQKNHLERLMEWRGKIDFDNPGAKDFQLSRDPQTGQYHATGNIYGGLDEQGNPIMLPYNEYHSGTADVKSIVSDYDDMLSAINVQNKAIKENYLLQNGTRNPNDLLNQ
jgi:hypothetical protein